MRNCHDSMILRVDCDSLAGVAVAMWINMIYELDIVKLRLWICKDMMGKLLWKTARCGCDFVWELTISRDVAQVFCLCRRLMKLVQNWE